MATTYKYSTIPAQEKALLIAGWLQDKKALQPVVLDLSKEYALAEATVIVSATSPRHAQGLSDHVVSMCKDNKFERFHVEGETAAQWILIDLNDVIVHILLPDARQLYRLEDLWTKAPVLLDARTPQEEKA